MSFGVVDVEKGLGGFAGFKGSGEAELEVEVAGVAASGVAHDGEVLLALDLLPHSYLDASGMEVGVTGEESVGVGDNDMVAPAGAAFSQVCVSFD